jgi:hypothetical protein
MIESNDKDYSKFYDSNIPKSQRVNKSQLFNTDTEPIIDNSNHYLCTKCLKFPFIEFCKDRRNIRLTCSCFNNKKILIEDLFSFENKYNLLIKKSNLFTTINSNKNNNIIIKNNFFCKKHKKKFKCFSINYLDNKCSLCFKYEKERTVDFNDIKIENGKILQLLEKINEHNDYNNDIINNIIIIKNNDSYYGKLSEDENKRFKQIINIIINDYKNYPNLSHFLNIKNLLRFFKIENNQNIKKEEKKDYILTENIEPIIIDYLNN